nr:RNA-dependent RNA polymerase [Picobirnavirus sp.]
MSVISTNNGLKQYLSNLSKGRSATPRSWLYESKEPDQILNDWLHILSRLSNGSTTDKSVYQFDTSQLKKWGPQGKVLPIEQLLSDIVLPTFSSGSSKPEGFTTRAWSTAKTNSLRQLFQYGVMSLRPASYSNVVTDMRARDTLESNSGWPAFSRRKRPEVLSAAINDASNLAWMDYPAIALFRNYNQKTRLVWMFPEATNIYEGSFCQPVQSRIINSRLPFFAPWKGFDEVRQLVTAAYDQNYFLTASDFSSTDAHFQVDSTLEVFDVLKNVFQKAYAGGLRTSLRRMHEIPLIIGRDKMITGKHGVSSGSNWTNFVETVFDFILSNYVAVVTKGAVKGLCAIGDDMCWISPKFNDDLHKDLEHFGAEVGQVINAEKVTNKENEVKFLQRLFIRGYRRQDGLLRGVYSTVRALKSLVYPERFHKPASWSSDMFCARQFMILENCVDHPLFEEFVKYVVHGHRDLIPFARKSPMELHKIFRESKLLPGLNPTYNQEKRDSSLANFESVKLAQRF